MKSSVFKTGGALTKEHSSVYIERQADTDVLNALANPQAMDYLLIIEPRQQGKTSLINHLMDQHMLCSNAVFVYLDLEDLDCDDEQSWFGDIWNELIQQCSMLLNLADLPIPTRVREWREQMERLAARSQQAGRRLVIVLDEIENIQRNRDQTWSRTFFAAIRKLYNLRSIRPSLDSLTFILVGVFHPRDLIPDGVTSPFNIAQRVRLTDFSLEQVQELASKGYRSEGQNIAFAQRIHYWTDGQPYLTQLLCSYLEPDATSIDVDTAVTQLRREDENHLPPMLERLNSDKKLRRYVERILAGERIEFYPQEDRQRQAPLELLGVIKEGPEGFCVVRNRIYERVLAGTSGEKSDPPIPVPTLHPELNNALTRRTLALFIGADLSREVAGLPSRAELARELARRNGLDQSLSLAEVAQQVSQAGNRWEFTAFIRDQLDTASKSLQPFHQRIVALVKEHQIETIITTAYDNLLELAFQEAGVGINRVVRGSDVNFINPDRPTLIRLHGDAQQPDSLVVTDRDHSDLLRDRDKEALVDEVRRAFRRNTMLFLGYNLSDPDFRFLFDQIANSRFARTAYAVWPGLPAADVRMWRDRGIVILDDDPLGVLESVLVPSGSLSSAHPTASELRRFIDEDFRHLEDALNDVHVSQAGIGPSTRWSATSNWNLHISRAIDIPEHISTAFDRVIEVRERAWGGATKLSIEQLSVAGQDIDQILEFLHERFPAAGVKRRSSHAEIAVSIDKPSEPASSSTKGVDMDYERGLDALKRLARDTDWHQDFAVHEASLRDNLRDERRYGPSEQTRRDRTRIVDQLNALALKHLGFSFNDLCLGEEHAAIPAHKRVQELISQGKRSLVTGDFAHAHHCFTKALEIEPDNKEAGGGKLQALLRWGYAELALQHYASAHDRFTQALEFAPDSAEARAGKIKSLCEWGSHELSQGHTAEANDLYRRALALDPPCPEALEGLERLARLSSPSSPRSDQKARVRFKLQIARLVGQEFEVRAFETPMGDSRAASHLPYNAEELVAILKALSTGSLAAAGLTAAQIGVLRQHGLLADSDLVADLHVRVGRALYQALFPGDVGAAFQMAWNQVRSQRGTVDLQLRFDEDAVELARYPWELLYYRRHLLPGGAVELSRYINYPEAPTTLSVEPPLRVLYVESRPVDVNPLPVDTEQATVRTALESLSEKGQLVLEELERPTYDALIDRLESSQDHILHFDGHGTMARHCPTCGAMNYPHHTTCQQPGCSRVLDDVPPLGYLAFEGADRRVDWVDSKALEHILYDSTVRVAVLSACRSSEVRGETLFGGTGPALIQAGIPAVVAMQVPITVSATTQFMQGFYGALARFELLSAAMTSGRRRLFRGQEWFIPALYLRSHDEEGHLFNRR